MPGAAALFLVAASQTAPKGSAEPNALGRPGTRQNRCGKLDERLRGAPVLQPRDRLVLLRRAGPV